MTDGQYRSICTLCHCGCGIQVEIKDGKMVRVTPDPAHPSNRQYLCPKVLGIEELSTSADRLTGPLRRAKSGFVPISWEEAYDFAAEKLSEIVAIHGPDSVIRCAGAPVSYGARDGFSYLMKAIGTANATGSSTYCMVPRVTAFHTMVGGKPEPDFDNSDFIILWGSNPKATNRLGGYCAFDGIQDVLNRARARGATIVFIDPVECESIKDGDEWVSIKPGTDVVLGLGMLRYIINEGLYDHQFIEDYTIGFDELRAHVQAFTPEYVERQTEISAERMVSLADRFAKAKTALICDGNGLDMYCNTVYTVQTVAALCAITGRIDKKGGLVFLPFVPQSRVNDLDPNSMKQKYKYPLFRDIPFPAVKESLLNGDEDRPRAMIVHHANPVLINANSKRTYKAMRSLNFLLVSDIFMTATAEAADLILPETTAFESYGFKAYSSFNKPFVAFQRPLFDGPAQMRSAFQNEYEIAKRMGLSDVYPYHDNQSWINYLLSPANITFEQLQEEQLIFLEKSVVYKKYETNGFNTPSKKLELYGKHLESEGYSPLPIALEGAPEIADDEDKFPLLAINYRPGQYVHTKLHNIKSVTKGHVRPKAWLNTHNLDVYNLKESDLILVESKFGTNIFEVICKPSLDDRYILLEFGWGNPTDTCEDINRLTDDRFFDPISGTTPNRVFRARVAKINDEE